MDSIIGVAVAVGVVAGMMIWTRQRAKENAALAVKIREALASGPLKLPELVARAGLADGFRNRGKLMMVLNPMVARGEVLQEEPPGTTVRNRLDVLTFSLKKAA